MTVTTTVTIQTCTYAKTAIKCCGSQNQTDFQTEGTMVISWIFVKKNCSTNGFACFVVETENKNIEETCEIKWTKKRNLNRKKNSPINDANLVYNLSFCSKQRFRTICFVYLWARSSVQNPLERHGLLGFNLFRRFLSFASPLTALIWK